MSELVPLVTEEGHVYGSGRADIVHEQGLLHSAVRAILISPDRKAYVQQRSAEKRVYPLSWECPAGHVKFGEPLEQAIHREVLEETGLMVKTFEKIGTYLTHNKKDNLFYTLFVAVNVTGTVRLQQSEVSAYCWNDVKQIDYELATTPHIFTPGFHKAWALFKAHKQPF